MSANSDNQSAQQKAALMPYFADEDPELTPERYWERRQRESNQLTFGAAVQINSAGKQ